MSENLPVIVVHGGAGNIRDEIKEDAAKGAVIARDRAWKILIEGGSALDAVEQAVIEMENYPIFNAGRGSVLTGEGTIEMDAMIVDGTNNNIGGVIGVSRIRNPISLSRKVMENSFHLIFSGRGAEKFAEKNGIEMIQPDELVTDRVRKRLDAFKKDNKKYGDYIKPLNDPEMRDKYGTVGAVAVDIHGNVAAATSTGGVLGKETGRVGDTPIFGAGTYANKELAVSATGVGEFIIKSMLGIDISHRYREVKNLQEATRGALTNLAELTKGGAAGVIVVSKKGDWAAMKNTQGLIFATKTPNDSIVFTDGKEINEVMI